ncbi:UTP--GlnB (protein PII) uridylyltransferase, GlnD [Malonomonas rubra DSM 5091]|uniref:Bifunctional uridylyltransferase/uridylyl-removing enzyme n=1 Tax=Malonomonas rubra DSM 5091 TaxID=1122189 RepID=A0A1M6KI29_MALRU|nr:[protein-PII] uridylyltransferase [Malonomonas rubra]SHJ58598.1 UTP--GlnB (protein PII) uridylyltransferase, GlnD [Malonomonas rubra DSM 5091]
MTIDTVPDINTSFPTASLLSSAPYEERRQAILEATREFITSHLERTKKMTIDGASGRAVVQELTAAFDQLNDILFQVVSYDLDQDGVDQCALIALGGYGRGEMNPKSDLDLMFYFEPKGEEVAKIISDRMLYLLWDLGLDVGYSVRSAKDCIDHCHDTTVRTSLLDARLLCGNPDVYAGFQSKVGSYILNNESQKFIKLKLEENNERRKKYGSSVYMLEPNLKEGEGGLRDLHACLWIAQVKFKANSLQELVIKGVINEAQAADYRAALDYLWKIRNYLHFLGQRKSDQITFELQRQIADAFGYKDGRKGSAVEQFMQNYYQHAAHVEHLASNMIVEATQRDKLQTGIVGFFSRRSLEHGFTVGRGELGCSDEEIFKKNPALIMTAFELAQRHGVKLNLKLKALIREDLHLINDKVRRSKQMNESFMSILRHPKNVGKILRKMHHLHVLNAFIPEFKNIFCKVQFDLYHVYTVDIHTLFAIEQMGKLWAGEYAEAYPLLTDVANNIEKRELLLLSIMFHDIGKGSGSDHSSRGAAMIPTISRRMGLNREDSHRLQFLVQHHLKMAHISQRRDLHDMKMITQFAELMGMSENLRMLYLLTFSDLKAVGPDVWSEWKGQLLQELYEKTYDVLEKKDFFQEMRSEKVRNRKRKVREALAGEFPESRINKAINSLNTRYLMSYRSKQIIPHLRLALGRGRKTLALQAEQVPETGYTELTLATIDSPGLFSIITGVMAGHSINILGAQIHTRKTGAVLDVLQVNSAVGDIVSNEAKLKRVEKDLIAAIEGRLNVQEMVEKAQREPDYMQRTKEKPKRPNKVEFDNEVSDQYTVIDIFANDKVGLLYNIARTLSELGLYIAVSKISTKVDQAADVFYVSDIFGQKITDPEKIEQIRQTMLERIA